MRLPRSSSGRPITAEERTRGCSSSAASTSAGYTLEPPARIMSVWRSARYVAVGIDRAHVAERFPTAVDDLRLRTDVAVRLLLRIARPHEDLTDLAGFGI